MVHEEKLTIVCKYLIVHVIKVKVSTDIRNERILMNIDKTILPSSSLSYVEHGMFQSHKYFRDCVPTFDTCIFRVASSFATLFFESQVYFLRLEQLIMAGLTVREETKCHINLSGFIY